MNTKLATLLTFSIQLLSACQAAPQLQASYANHDPPVLQALCP